MELRFGVNPTTTTTGLSCQINVASELQYSPANHENINTCHFIDTVLLNRKPFLRSFLIMSYFLHFFFCFGQCKLTMTEFFYKNGHLVSFALKICFERKSLQTFRRKEILTLLSLFTSVSLRLVLIIFTSKLSTPIVSRKFCLRWVFGW